MRTVPAELEARLGAGATTLCTCWRLTRRDGAVLGFTDHDEDVILDDVRCVASSGLDTAAQEGALGLSTDTTEVAGALTADAITAASIDAGLFDGAAVERWLVDWQAPHLRFCLFAGRLGEIIREGGAFRAEVLGLAAALNAPVGRVCLQLCDAQLGDDRCGADLSTPPFVAQGNVLWSDPQGLAMAGLDAFEPGWFTQGRLLWPNGDELRVVAHWVEAGLHRVSLNTASGAGGDTCTLFAGCDRRAETCRSKFDNLLNFRGFPHMPGDDWALTAAPAAGGVHDGGSRQ